MTAYPYVMFSYFGAPRPFLTSTPRRVIETAKDTLGWNHQFRIWPIFDHEYVPDVARYNRGLQILTHAKDLKIQTVVVIGMDPHDSVLRILGRQRDFDGVFDPKLFDDADSEQINMCTATRTNVPYFDQAVRQVHETRTCYPSLRQVKVICISLPAIPEVLSTKNAWDFPRIMHGLELILGHLILKRQR